MPLQVRCSCGQIYQLPDEMAGKKVRCQSCRQVFQVPAGSNSPAAPQQNVARQPANQPQAPLQPQAPQPQQAPLQQAPLQQAPLQQAPLQQPMAQQPMGQPMPGAYANPAYPAHKKKTSAPKNKLLLFGSIGGGVLVLVIVLIIAFSGGNKDKEAGESNEKVADRGKSEKANSQNDKSNTGGTMPGGTTGNSKGGTQNQLSTHRFYKSDNGLCTLVAYLKINQDAAASVSRNGLYFTLCEQSPGKTKISLFHRDKPDQIQTHELDGKYAVTAVNNDGRILGLRNSKRSEIFDWQTKKVLRIAEVSFFTPDSKYAIILSEARSSNAFIAAYDIARDSIVWATEHSRSKVISSDLSHEFESGFGEKIYKVDMTTRESSEFIEVPRSKTGNEYVFARGGSHVLVRSKKKVVGYDLAGDGKKILEMELEGHSSHRPGTTSANQSIAALTIQRSSMEADIVIVDIKKQKVIDRIPAYPSLVVTLSDDGSTISCKIGSTRLAIWKVDHKVPGTHPVDAKPFFLDLPADQRIASKLANQFKEFNAASKDTSKPVTREEQWSNEFAKVHKITFSSTLKLHEKFMLSAEGNHIATGANPDSTVGSAIMLWDKRFLPQPITKQGWLMGIGTKGNLIGIKQWLSRNRRENDRIDVWDFANEKMIFQTTGSGFGDYMAFSPDGKSFLIEKDDQVVQYDLASGKPQSPTQTWAKTINGVSPDFKQLVEIQDGTLKFYDIASRKLEREVSIPYGRPEWRNAISFESNRMVLKRGAAIALVDLTSGKELGEHRLPSGSTIWRARISPDGEKAIICYLLDGQHHYLLVKLTPVGIQPIGEIKRPADGRCEDFAFSNDGTELFTIAANTSGRSSRYVLWWKVSP